MVSIARRNMFREKGRFAVTAIGIAASIMLILFGVGMSIGIWDSMVTVVDHSNADIWVLNSQNVDLAQGQSILPAKHVNANTSNQRRKNCNSINLLVKYRCRKSRRQTNRTK